MTQTESSDEQSTQVASIQKIWRVVLFTAGSTLVIAGLIAGAFFLISRSNQTPGNPFAGKSVSSLGFPVYYSTKLPQGYAVDPSSISQPHDGVLLFNLTNGQQKIVVTEEARSSKMVNLGGFYKQLSDLNQTVVSDGSIATGYFHSTKVASRANNKTWILVTTTSNVSLSDLSSMLKNITAAP